MMIADILAMLIFIRVTKMSAIISDKV